MNHIVKLKHSSLISIPTESNSFRKLIHRLGKERKNFSNHLLRLFQIERSKFEIFYLFCLIVIKSYHIISAVYQKGVKASCLLIPVPVRLSIVFNSATGLNCNESEHIQKGDNSGKIILILTDLVFLA